MTAVEVWQGRIRSIADDGWPIWDFAATRAPARLHCLIAGHDDGISRAAGRLALRCHYCGRCTTGWAIESAQPRQASRLLAAPKGSCTS